MPDYIPVLIIVALAPVFWSIATYNRLVRYRNMIEEAWSGIDVALKRRFNLIPNLIEAVKGYAEHEADVLQQVTEQRKVTETPNQRTREESEITKSLTGVLAVAESYPDLKASANFLAIQHSLNEIEQEIQGARQRYNTMVRRLNTSVEQFPSNMIAKMFGFRRHPYFTLELATQRELPGVEF